VQLYADLYKAVKKTAPDMKVMCHIHPVYLPNPFYGHRVKVDYCGVTVAWFFKPHWDLKKIEKYTKKTVNGPYKFTEAIGMPMIGYYTGETSYRDGKQLKKELNIIKKSGAKAVMMCELGHILKDEGASKAVQSRFLKQISEKRKTVKKPKNSRE
jgi:hypothetical protein